MPLPALLRRPYLWVCAGALAWAALIVSQGLWVGDFDLHMGTTRALIRDPLTPADPMIGGHQGSPYFSPYMLVLAAVAWVTQWGPQTALGVAGIANLALLLWTFARFCRRAGDHPWLPVLGLGAIVLLWGEHSVGWSGFLDLTSLSFALAYPSTVGAALLFACWDAFLGYRAEPSPRGLAAIAGLGALLALIHPFTALEAALGIAAFLLADVRAWPAARLGLLTLAGAAAAAAVAAWPYFDASSLFAPQSDLHDIHRPLVAAITVGHVGAYGLALVGLPALVLRWNRPLGRELGALFLVAATVVGAALTLGADAYARMIPLMLIPLQLSVAAYALEAGVPAFRSLVSGARERRVNGLAFAPVAYVALAALACVAGVQAAETGVRRAVPTGVAERASGPTALAHPVRAAEVAFLAGRIAEGDVVATDDGRPGSLRFDRVLTGMGAYTLAPAWPNPFAPDEAAHRAASTDLLDASTPPAERATITAKYQVRCVVVHRGSPLLEPGALPGFTPVAANPGGTTLLCRD